MNWHRISNRSSIQFPLNAELNSDDGKLLTAIFALQTYVQETITGPPLNSYNHYPFKLEVTVCSSLSTDGHMLESLITNPGALEYAKAQFDALDAENIHSPEIWCWKARAALVHHRSLVGGIKSDAPTLKKEVFSNYLRFATFYSWLPENFCIPDIEIQPSTTKCDHEPPSWAKQYILLEIGAVCSTYGYGEISRSLYSVDAHLSGRVGIKRRYQACPIPQLCVELNGIAESHEEIPINLVAARNFQLKDIDESTDVLEKPLYCDEEQTRPLTLPEQFQLLGWASAVLTDNSVNDDLAMSILVTIVNRILESSNENNPDNTDWIVWSHALWLRSLAEYHRTKWKERACLQILALEEQYSISKPDAETRLRNIWLTTFPNRWEICREAGKKFMQLGAFLTARDMYQKMNMWTEVVECLIIAGRKKEAEVILENELEKCSTPVLQCLMGDIHRDVQRYITAWDLSDGHYARAARSAGQWYLEHGDRNEALRWLSKSLTLQPFQLEVQFTYGCLLMQDDRPKEALAAFSHVVKHDKDQYEVWANMGAIHSQLSQWDSAKRCLQTAARIGGNKWRIWDSYASVCFRVDDIYGVLEGIIHMIDLDASSQIPVWMLSRLSLKIIEMSKTDRNCDLLGRWLKALLKYFENLVLPLPSNIPENTVFAKEPIRLCAERYRIWALVTDAAGLWHDTLEIYMKHARYLSRVVEDCLQNECPIEIREGLTHSSLIAKLLELWIRCINECFHFLAKKEEKMDGKQYKSERAKSRQFFEESTQHLVTVLLRSPLLTGTEQADLKSKFDAVQIVVD